MQVPACLLQGSCSAREGLQCLTHTPGRAKTRPKASSAGLGQQSQGGKWSQHCTGLRGLHSRRLKRGGSSHSAHPAESHKLQQLPAGITAKPQEKQQVFWVSHRKKGSRHEAHCAHIKSQLKNTAVSCKMWSDTHSDDTLLPFCSLPPYSIPATQSPSVLRTENCFLFCPRGHFSMHQ